jgi:glucokinase
MRDIILGIDVGGTNIKLGLVNPGGQIFSRSRIVTKDHTAPKELIKALIGEITNLLKINQLEKKQVKGIGIGLPGLIDVEKGIVKLLPNIAGWRDVPLEKILRQSLDMEIRLENDVNMITLGEWRFGAGQGRKDLVCMTLGTGVGAGLILNDALYRGEGFAAGEIGHMPLNETGVVCSCGGVGCFERYVGNAALEKEASRIFNRSIKLEEVSQLAAKGEKRALAFWHEAGVRIGNGLTATVNLLNPRLIIIGGGVSNSHRFLFPAIRETIKARAMSVQGSMVRVVRAKLGSDAGIIGACVLLENESRHDG